MAKLTPVTINRSANAIAGEDAAVGGDTFANNVGTNYLFVEHTNGAGSDIALTIVTTKTVDGEPVDDKELTITAGAQYLLGPFPAGIYNDGNGDVSITYSSNTDLKVAHLRL